MLAPCQQCIDGDPKVPLGVSAIPFPPMLVGRSRLRARTPTDSSHKGARMKPRAMAADSSSRA
eukprot:scaffold289730_cov36-Tisochrysis_lutea.AAC.3